MIIQQYTWLFVLLAIGQSLADFTVSEQDLTVTVDGQKTFDLYLNNSLSEDVEVRFDIQHSDLVKTNPANFSLSAANTTAQWTITVFGLSAGYSTVSANVTPSDAASVTNAFVRVTIEKSETLRHVSVVVGWVYFLAWSISFYPQIHINYKRKSVVGLNFDFLSLNIVGFVMYSLFNCGLYWIPEIEQEYFNRYPKGLNPVKVNDVVFALHAVFATTVTILQCFIYERGTQRVSIMARVIHGIFTIFILVSIILAGIDTIKWLDFLYYCSYVKLAITLIKYVPQAFYNYKRKSTIGWSIGNIFLDFTGGMLSMLQMILDAYNYDDWDSIFGDPTKFGLGFFSVAFDIFFLVQHYVLYRDRNDYLELPEDCCEDQNQENHRVDTSLGYQAVDK
ncbi:cystinosin homolog isoform X1 [Neodiprion virginianus]|uniref:cystinosin homolog isoform X1 n=1 Tax=Neodiprion fabricii TaxID=2872261 RepID=UPI001ED907B8|nr:cystinosin homolog isoform X1 [Neodiprion fabricii]XP_046422071.1 cystinosin homolog isoform X1 [Neodiprion fabricii]XP_046422072.1 cystinosin homolog isoform X1 [Neodiprion fabricii]XP_046422074.1 cystinosin homolog isoform X1 [Neodiprion fabricii]XP_046422075.1 cystinosin homolog isoform X1 [Neodiprion fabricii]XP_046615266.1 cystinosin homolog isoform X1 [Neodiprion virginianus]XP_046615267.1 cystinosin homolog isoform X1 [Neodiprion virginianus]XP_046615268.1 cystinosin homolog isofor